MKQISCLLLALTWAVLAPAQPANPQYPQGYFRNPLRIPIILAGNFGECRPGHFHSGLDIKTGGHENEPVFAAADGYVSRIKMQPGGFGHAIYITHPNGYTTLYAHLNDFMPKLQQYLRQQQYARESWTLDLSLSPEQFPVKKGEQIAWSGNTGGSTAPHLHFEIRDTKTEHPLNPELFGFEIHDDLPPVLKRLALYDLRQGIYDTQPELFPLRKKKDLYAPASDSLTIHSGTIGIALQTDDYMPGSRNTLAPYEATWYLDGALQGRIRLDDIGYDRTRYLHAYADYSTHETKGFWLQCLFRLPGNRLEQIYSSLNPERGMLQLRDEAYHQLRVGVRDAMGNKSELLFYLRSQLLPIKPACAVPAQPNESNRFETADARCVLDATELYDQACISMSARPDSNMLSKRIQIGEARIPVHHAFELSIRPSRLIPFALRSKIVIRYSDGKEQSGVAASLGKEGWYQASVRALGTYWLEADTEEPELRLISPKNKDFKHAKAIQFLAQDKLSSVDSFRGELDGKWILFEQHRDTWTYRFDEHCPKGAHKLVIRLSDENGNTLRREFTFTR
ncbi:MAG: M23 family metallopeptidase [Bacteroidetes bacterium]|nr:M23 family metallopeptidase [Bacteroidota bacterium]